jgi:hypothetical protein
MMRYWIGAVFTIGAGLALICLCAAIGQFAFHYAAAAVTPAGYNPNSAWEQIGEDVFTRCDHGNRVYLRPPAIAAVKGCD